MDRTQYDELHDRFFSILSSNEGTRYERLAAVVLKALHEQNSAIHDFKLRGDSHKYFRSVALTLHLQGFLSQPHDS